MVHETAVNRLYLRMIVITLFAVVAVTIGMYFYKHQGAEPKPDGDCSSNISKGLELSGAEMSKLFQFPSSKASMFLAAYNSTPENGKVGVILWREESGLERNMSLSKNGAQIRVNDQGFYLVFVQASFRVPNVNRENLWLKLVVHYPESHNQYSAVFTTHVGTQSSDEIDVVLNKPVLVWLRPGNYLTVLTHPFDLVERESNPSSTFLTVFKYSD